MVGHEVLNQRQFHSLLRVLRWGLPLLVFLVTFALELHEFFEAGHRLQEFAIFGLVMPVLIWLIFSALVSGLHQRDAARFRLQVLYKISSEVAGAPDEPALVQIAADTLGRLLGPVPTSLIMRERDNSPWVLAEARRLQPGQEQALASALAEHTGLPCSNCPHRPGAFVKDCALQQVLDLCSAGAPGRGVVCLPLANQERVHGVITAYVDRAPSGLDDLRPLLASLSSGFATALERARLRARELAVLGRAERAARHPEALPELLYGILADVTRGREAQAGYIYVTSGERGDEALSLLSAWPSADGAHEYLPLARKALGTEDITVETRDALGQTLAVGLAARGTRVGVLVLVGQPAGVPTQPVTLQATAQLIALAVRNGQLTAELEGRAVLDERNRLAGEVHDRVAQDLGYLNFKVQEIDELARLGGFEAGRPQLQELRKQIKELYAEVRLTIDDLRWPLNRGEGIATRIEQYCQHMSERSGLTISVFASDSPALSPRAEVQLIRILQEALLNIQRHATANRVDVKLCTADGNLILTVEDDGQGFLTEQAEQPGHFGLRIMAERAAALDGSLAVTSVPQSGTRLDITVPLDRSWRPVMGIIVKGDGQ